MVKGFTSSPPYLSILIYTRELIDGSVASHRESRVYILIDKYGGEEVNPFTVA